MKYLITFLFGVFFVVSSPGTSFAGEEISLNAKWKNGLRIESEDGSVKLALGGRAYADWSTFASSDKALEASVGELEDGTEFRAARLYIAGTLYDKLVFKTEYDFAGGESKLKDTYIGLKGIPLVNNIRVGHFKESVGLENLTSSRFTTFMERGLVNTFAPGRNNGVMVFDTALDKRMTWALGVFRETDDFGEGTGDDNGYSYTGRITGLPCYSDDGSRLLHLGASYSFRNFDKNEVRYRNRPEVHNSPRFVDTETIAADSAGVVGAELAVVWQAISLQAEYAQTFVDGKSDGDFSFPSYYVLASYFLTGEHRVYKQSKGAFDRMKPIQDYLSEASGPGAWELAARYSWVDLNDGVVTGGELSDFTLGINWYLHANTRVMLNWVHADVDSVGEADILQTRFQVDF